MNREIKFRASENGKFYYSDSQEDCRLLGGKLGSSLIATFLNRFYGHETLSQFTGLKDKNGVDIYEGDLIGSLGFGNLRVEFFDGMFCAFKIIEESNQENAWRIDWLIKTYNLEVIGNIHEKPELI